MYKAILTKTLQIEINIASIDIYLRKFIQRLITNIESRMLNAIIVTTI